MSYEHVLHSLKQRVPNVREMLLTDECGWTIAHYYVQHYKPKNGFEFWGICDETNWTVAHAAAATGHLSDDFNAWEYVDDNGDTVAHIAIRTGNDLGYSPKWSNHILKMANKAGVTVRDEINRRDNERFTKLKELLK